MYQFDSSFIISLLDINDINHKQANKIFWNFIIEDKVSVVDASIIYDSVYHWNKILTFDKQLITIYKQLIINK